MNKAVQFEEHSTVKFIDPESQVSQAAEPKLGIAVMHTLPHFPDKGQEETKGPDSVQACGVA